MVDRKVATALTGRVRAWTAQPVTVGSRFVRPVPVTTPSARTQKTMTASAAPVSSGALPGRAPAWWASVWWRLGDARCCQASSGTAS